MNRRHLMMIRLYLTPSPSKRVKYLRKKKVFHSIGNNVMIQNPKLPLYPNLISIGSNVYLATGVTFLTHDVVHYVLNYVHKVRSYKENIGCISIGDNVFIGANTQICSNVKIGSNVVVGGGSVITKDLPSNGVYAGVPARRICSFDDLDKKRALVDYVNKIGNDVGVTPELEQELWERFALEHKDTE